MLESEHMEINLDFSWKHEGKYHYGTINKVLYRHGSSIICRYYSDIMRLEDGTLMFNPLILFKKGKAYFLKPESFEGDLDYADFESKGCSSHAYDRLIIELEEISKNAFSVA